MHSSRQGIPKLGEQSKAFENCAATIPGEFQAPGGIWGMPKKAQDGGGSGDCHLGFIVIADA